MDERDNRISRTNGLNTWRAGCDGSRTSGSEGGPGKPTSRKADRAPRSDPYAEAHDEPWIPAQPWATITKRAHDALQMCER